MKEEKRREIYLKGEAPRKKNIYNDNIYEDKIMKDIKERKNKIIINNRIIIIYIIIIKLVILSNNNNIIKYSNIKLKIKGNGYNNIFNSDYNIYPDEIYINENKINNINYSYYFNNTNNYIELMWNKTINTCYRMFSGCINITEIDLSNLNTSQVTNMNSMFYNCESLTSLDLSNLNTSLIVNHCLH